MDNFNVYSDIKARTNGEIYVGIVGPVRTGKSTFIKRFMELMVLPGMDDPHARERTRDELPQSSAGKTIMTTEPKFIPKEAAQIALSDGVDVKVRLIDCVGFMVEGAAGHIENDTERLVKTPWFDAEIPFTEAAEIGTRKVINDHSTIGLVITTDGSFGDIKRGNYIAAEEKTIKELKNLKKPFLVLLNSMRPYSDETRELAKQMEENGFFDKTRDIIESYQLKQIHFMLEITERAAMKISDSLLHDMNTLKSSGITFSLDDFGMGHNSILYLQEGIFNEVKLDGQLVSQLPGNGRSKDIISGIIRMADSLDLRVLAEFVETKEQRDMLAELGCNHYQGYYYSRPLPLAELVEYISVTQSHTEPLQAGSTEKQRNLH